MEQQSCVEDYLDNANNIKNDLIVQRVSRHSSVFSATILDRALAELPMTTRPCAICHKDVLYGSTCTDVLCDECAKLHDLCKALRG